MSRLIATAFVSLDGVMQAPGGPEEDPVGGFEYGGWTVPYWDDVIGSVMGEVFSSPFALVLGRKTYDIFAAHWPCVEVDRSASTFDEVNAQAAQTFNEATKYVATHAPETLSWQNSESLGADVPARIRELKKQNGQTLLVQGSSELLQTLLAHDLVDEIRLLIYPVVFGKGKRFFGSGAIPGAFKLTSSTSAPSGVLIASYERAGEVRTGSFALDYPTPEEIERRKHLK
ncbi:MAG: dihydrofolate reductase family protein [Steroidobacteraceae bacterium]